MTNNRSWHSYLGEFLFFISYACFLLYLFPHGKKILFAGDAMHAAILCQWAGHFLGGTRWGGSAWKHWLGRFELKPAFVTLYVGWSLIWGVIAICRYYGFNVAEFDLGVFSQSFWNLSRGRGWETQMTLGLAPSLMGDHQYYTLAIFAPLFWTPFGAELLLLIQPFLFLLPGLLTALWVTKFFEGENRKLWAWTVFLSWTLSSLLVGNMLWDFHETALTVPFLSAWAWALITGNLPLFLASGLLAGLTKEHLLITTVPGIAVFFLMHWRKLRSQRPLRQGLTGWGLVSCAVILLQLAAFGLGQRYFSTPGVFTERYSALGNGVGEIVINAVLKPKLILSILFSHERLLYFRDLLAPFGLAPLYSGWAILAGIPVILAHALSTVTTQISRHFHYILEAFAILIVFSLPGWKVVKERILKNHVRRERLFIALIISCVLWYAPTSFVHRFMDFYPRAAQCAGTRWELREAVRDWNRQCQDPRGAAGTGSDGLTNLLVDIVPVFTKRGGIEELRRRDGYTRLLEQNPCAFVVTYENEARKIFEGYSGKYSILRTWNSCGERVPPIHLYVRKQG